MSILEWLTPVRQRLRVRTGLWAVAAAVVAWAPSSVVAHALGARAVAGHALGVVLAAGTVGAVVWRARGQWHWLRVADVVEAGHRECGNCVRALVDVELQRILVSATARARLESAAVERLAGLRPSSVVPLRAPAAFALCAVAGAIAVATAAPEGAATGEVPPVGSALADTALELTLDLTPPAYLNQAPHVVSVEGEVTVPEGTTARLRVATHWSSVWMASAEGAPALTPGSGNRWVSEPFPVDAPRLLVVAAGPVPGDLRESRAVSLLVADDRVPDVSVVAPGRDIVRAPGSAEPLTVRIEASDDHRLEALELRYVRLAGGGETFTFTEGTVPLIRDESSPRRWTADVRWAIGRLGLERGESLVYRAAVRDSHPGRGWIFSDSFVIDVGTPFEAGGAGASLPEEDRRYAISQQMVIVKTERLQAQRRALAPAALLEQSQLLSAEQRRVRAEVVFLSGGEIADEVEEAEHSHELQEGRLENVGRAEMVRAMAEMSRAETALTAGDLDVALRFERAALAALQRAFDRRRYFLRTPTERTRIDPSRRLSGERRGVQGAARPFTPSEATASAALEAVTRAADALSSSPTPTADRIAQLLALAPDDRAWRQLVEDWAAAAQGKAAPVRQASLLQWLRARQVQLMPPASAGLPSLVPGAGFVSAVRPSRETP